MKKKKVLWLNAQPERINVTGMVPYAHVITTKKELKTAEANVRKELKTAEANVRVTWYL